MINDLYRRICNREIEESGEKFIECKACHSYHLIKHIAKQYNKNDLLMVGNYMLETYQCEICKANWPLNTELRILIKELYNE